MRLLPTIFLVIALLTLTRAEEFEDVEDDFYHKDPTVKDIKLPVHRWLQVYLLDGFKAKLTKKDQVIKVRKQVLGLGTYFHKIVGIEGDNPNDYDFVLIDVDITKWAKKKHRVEHIGHKAYMMEAANALAALKGIKAIESIYEPVYGGKITDAEREAHIKYLEGGFMEDARFEYWENNVEDDVKKWYEQEVNSKIETRIRKEVYDKHIKE
jgi:hypothetical protein